MITEILKCGEFVVCEKTGFTGEVITIKQVAMIGITVANVKSKDGEEKTIALSELTLIK